MSKILLIDDKQDNLISISALLKNLIPGCSIITADSGAKGIEKAEMEQPDTILLDIKMPEMDGFEVCERLQSVQKTKHIPVVMLTAIKTDAKSRVKGLALGADAFLSKPIDENELVAQIGVMLRIKKTEDLLRKERDSLDQLVAERTAEMRESYSIFSQMFAQSTTSMCLYNPGGTINRVNSEFCRMFGVEEEVIIKSGYNVFQDEAIIRAGRVPLLKNVFHEKKIRSWEINFDVGVASASTGTPSSKTGKIFLEVFGYPLLDRSGDLKYVVLQHHDISNRKRAEEELRKSGEKLRAILDNSPITIWCFDGEEYSYLSGEWYRYTGQDPMLPLTVERWMERIHPDDLERVGGIWAAHWKAKTPHDNYFRLKGRDDKYREIHCRAFPIFDREGHFQYFQGFNFDVTEKKELEAQLQQARKMEAIGTLAGGIAHDFNNVLYAMMGYTELSIGLVPEGSEVKKYLNRAMKSADRAKEMVQQILTFSRQAEKQKKPIRVQSILKEVGDLIRTSFPSTIEIRRDVDPECGPIMADSTQIHQIIMNLSTNAYHAMEDKGGVLGLRLIQEEIDPDDSENIQGLEPGGYLKLIVEDTGSGIDGGIVGRIFDPYFTTKAAGKGTGLGLSVVHGIVKEHGGDIRVFSEPGKGTAFHVYLPLLESGTDDAGDKSAEPVPKGAERILFVDDDEMIADLALGMLGSLGYQVTSCAGSLEALEVFRGRPDEFDLLVTDMTMPHMTGSELASEILKIRPDIPIVLCTGFSEQLTKERAMALGIRAYLEKPIAYKEMARVIRRVLEAPDVK